MLVHRLRRWPNIKPELVTNVSCSQAVEPDMAPRRNACTLTYDRGIQFEPQLDGIGSAYAHWFSIQGR